MKLIVEKNLNRIYIYRETEKHFKRIENTEINSGGRKGLAKVDFIVFDNECDALISLKDGQYTVFDLK